MYLQQKTLLRVHHIIILVTFRGNYSNSYVNSVKFLDTHTSVHYHVDIWQCFQLCHKKRQKPQGWLAHISNLVRNNQMQNSFYGLFPFEVKKNMTISHFELTRSN